MECAAGRAVPQSSLWSQAFTEGMMFGHPRLCSLFQKTVFQLRGHNGVPSFRGSDPPPPHRPCEQLSGAAPHWTTSKRKCPCLERDAAGPAEANELSERPFVKFFH